MNNNKGQVTAFILIGIVLLIIFGSLFIIVDKFALSDNNLALTPQGFVQDCLKIATRQSLEILGRHEAVPISFDPLKLQEPNDQKKCISLSTQGEQVVIPTTADTQEQLEPLITKNLITCLGDFKELNNQGYRQRIIKEPKTTITFTPQQVVVEAEYEIEFTKGDQSETVDELFLSMPSNYKDIHQSAHKGAAQYTKTKELPAEAYNKFEQTLLVTPTEQGTFTIAVDESANLFSPINYTFPFY